MHSMLHLGRLRVKFKQYKFNITDLDINEKMLSRVQFCLNHRADQ